MDPFICEFIMSVIWTVIIPMSIGFIAGFLTYKITVYNRINKVGYDVHPSWNTSQEFNEGWRECRIQIQEELNR